MCITNKKIKSCVILENSNIMLTTIPQIPVTQFEIRQSQTLFLNRPLSCLLKLPEVMAYQRTISKHNKLMRQLNYMKSCMTRGCIPQGIKDQARFKLSFPNIEIHNTCQNLFYFAASRASDVIRTHVSKTVEALRQSVKSIDKQLEIKLSIKEMKQVVEHIGKRDQVYDKQQKEIHARKLL